VVRSLVLTAMTAAGLGAASPIVAQVAPRIVVRMRPFTAPIVLDTLARTHDVERAPAAVLDAAVAAFESFKIKTEIIDSARGIVANLKFVKTGRLGGVQLSRFVNCGMGITGPNADGSRVTLAIAVLVDPLSGARARFGIAIVGSAINMTGNSVEPNACLSTGVLEEKLADIIQNRLTSGS